MGRIQDRFAMLKDRGEAAFVAYICAGDPSIAQTEEIVLGLEEAGVDVVEIGVPFSEPLADGPVNQRASERALANGVTLEDVISMVGRLRERTQIPIIFYTYYNLVMHMGLETFAAKCRDNQVDGVLVLDLPPEESGEYLEMMRLAECDTVYLMAPTSTDARIKKAADASTGFVYYVQREGVTGMRDTVATNLGPMMERIRAATDLPVTVGFGVSTPEHARQVASQCDGVVVGSAIVNQIAEQGDVPELAAHIRDFVRPLVAGAKGLDPVTSTG